MIEKGYVWQEELKNNLVSAEDLFQAELIAEKDVKTIAEIIDKYPLNITDYYMKLIEKFDYSDPIYKMCVASLKEDRHDGSLDVSGEAINTVDNGIQHKYKNTVLLLSTNVCAMYCRHCFRKRMVGLSEEETLSFTEKAVAYVAEHPEVDNVLITGGDSFMNSNKVIESYLKGLSKIEHLKFIRFGTRLPVVMPQRIYKDGELIDILSKYNKQKPLYVVTQFNHPRELTLEAKMASEVLREARISVLHQSVMLAGVNDNVQTLVDLFNGLIENGISPYYLFQCRPIKGVEGYFTVPFTKGVEIVEEVRTRLSGVAKRFRYALSHINGKMEILGITQKGELLVKQHQAKDPKNLNKIFTVPLSDKTYWLPDDIEYNLL